MKTLAALVALMLTGCVTVVDIHDAGRSRLSAWPGGVKIQRGPGDVVRTSQLTLGVAYQCGVLGLGASVITCAVAPLTGGAWRAFTPPNGEQK